MNQQIDNLDVSKGLIHILKNPQSGEKQTLQKALYQLNMALKKGYDPTHMNYYVMNTLLGEVGIAPALLYPFLKSLVSKKQFIFKQDKSHFPTETMMSYLAGHAYWLDRNLFNDQVVCRPSYAKQNTTTENDLVNLLDVGCLLLKKGFQFPDVDRLSNPEIGHYMKTYICMVKKRFQRMYHTLVKECVR